MRSAYDGEHVGEPPSNGCESESKPEFDSDSMGPAFVSSAPSSSVCGEKRIKSSGDACDAASARRGRPTGGGVGGSEPPRPAARSRAFSTRRRWISQASAGAWAMS